MRVSSLLRVILLLAAWAAAGLPYGAKAGEAKVAVASNFTRAAKEIAASFQRRTSHRAVLVFASTGKLYAQILHGAPFDLYLAADQKRPKRAESNGLAVPGSRFTYAIGKITLYSPDPNLIRAAADPEKPPPVLLAGSFDRLAMGNPKTAPYGAAALQVLQKLGLYNRLRGKIVMGENIAQTYQFVVAGAAKLGFVANAQLAGVTGGSRWPAPDSFYQPVRQDAVLLRHGADNGAARAFAAFLKSAAAHDIIKKYGYGLSRN